MNGELPPVRLHRVKGPTGVEEAVKAISAVGGVHS